MTWQCLTSLHFVIAFAMEDRIKCKCLLEVIQSIACVQNLGSRGNDSPHWTRDPRFSEIHVDDEKSTQIRRNCDLIQKENLPLTRLTSHCLRFHFLGIITTVTCITNHPNQTLYSPLSSNISLTSPFSLPLQTSPGLFQEATSLLISNNIPDGPLAKTETGPSST